MIPRLATSRLVLRGLQAGDAPAMQAYASDWDVVRMLARVPYPYPEGEAEAFITEVLGGPIEDLPFRSVVIDVGGFAGLIAVTSEDRFRAPEVGLGYWIGKPFWGRGLMTEALTALLRSYVFGTLGAETVRSGVFADNPASLHIQHKLGFRVVGEHQAPCLARGAIVRHIDTALTRAEFLAAVP